MMTPSRVAILDSKIYGYPTTRNIPLLYYDIFHEMFGPL
jgi:hypothetical protein